MDDTSVMMGDPSNSYPAQEEAGQRRSLDGRGVQSEEAEQRSRQRWDGTRRGSAILDGEGRVV